MGLTPKQSFIEHKKINEVSFMYERNFAFAALSFTGLFASIYYQSTILNPMVSTTYGFKPEFSSLIYTIGAVGFVLGAPVVM